jgi:hypothetical protein
MKDSKTCSVDGCEKLARGRGWCHMHWRRWRVNGDPLTTRYSSYGSGSLRDDGYRQVYDGSGKKGLEHRKVMAEIIGRPLTHEEVVHHVDRNPRNNDPSNLVLCADQAEHLKLHMRESTCCRKGHPWGPENEYWYGGKRICRTCNLSWKRERYKRFRDS